jgi:RNA 2',3'-cyclic 3'-phosphodiesterase
VNDERVRLFVALSLPPDVRDALAGWRDQAVGSFAGLRPVAWEALHVTLCFLGSRHASELDAIAGACGTVASFDPVALTIGEPAWLPSRRPRVLGVSLGDADERLTRVQGELSQVLSAGGWYAPESRPFFPHVTVARTRKDARVRPVELPALPALSFVGSEVTLFRSRLSPRGARYEPLGSVLLGSGGGGAARSGGGGAARDPLTVVRQFHEAQRRAYRRRRARTAA